MHLCVVSLGPQIFRSKFDIIAPVWFDMGLAEDGEVTLSGTHDVDTEWLRAVRGGDGQRSPLILPRVTFRLSRLDNAIVSGRLLCGFSRTMG